LGTLVTLMQCGSVTLEWSWVLLGWLLRDLLRHTHAPL